MSTQSQVRAMSIHIVDQFLFPASLRQQIYSQIVIVIINRQSVHTSYRYSIFRKAIGVCKYQTKVNICIRKLSLVQQNI